MNPRAGKMQGIKNLGKIIQLFSDKGYDCSVQMTKKPGDGTPICRTMAPEFDLVVAIGGDGTLNEVICGMMESGENKPLGFIPAGSTNVFSANLGFPKQLLNAATHIVEGTPHPYDVGTINGRYFSFIAAFGAFIRTSHITPQNAKNALGPFAYVLQGIRDFPTFKPIHARVETPNGVFEDDYIFGAFCNSLTVAGLIQFNRNEINLHDGLLEILLIKYPTTPSQVSRILNDLSTQRYEPELITFCSTDQATVYLSKEVEWSIDGEYFEGSDENRIATLPDGIRFMR
jgi:YegS/Rv2252/BmrU family lipid kinase